MAFVLNGKTQAIPADWAGETLLFLLRDHFGLVGAKYGCGVGVCGACTVIVDGVATRSCITPAESIEGSEVRSVEGLATDGVLHPVQQAWLDLAVPQCGYCQPGQIMSAVALLNEFSSPSDADIDAAMDGNLCRCGTYGRIRAAIQRAVEAT
ncbi:(2Fe-2S)-binding protein [Hoeflea prorocentri]|uniref:(2Fe-2S)-binding protein n=1 Tax=Hoeflea prorocentri TaxID=1922333 RepID=A0A9X3UGA7_9HYPH|nr:(2Fe-2S)-binding protein [Hoeflea prorocentri]MCY6380094.1 (2Fe-2S)-binding protein [Hoeflea prorocentri]MDA5397894.1 (2Fe-2S)-binding protein [Hoeflea prorocentri]